MSGFVRVLVVLAGFGSLAALTSESRAGQAPNAPAALASAAPGTGGATTPAQAEGQQKALFESACGSCHDAAVATQQRMDRSGWEGTVAQMVGMGAPLDEQQAAQVADYLARHYGAG